MQVLHELIESIWKEFGAKLPVFYNDHYCGFANLGTFSKWQMFLSKMNLCEEIFIFSKKRCHFVKVLCQRIQSGDYCLRVTHNSQSESVKLIEKSDLKWHLWLKWPHNFVVQVSTKNCASELMENSLFHPPGLQIPWNCQKLFQNWFGLCEHLIWVVNPYFVQLEVWAQI